MGNNRLIEIQKHGQSIWMDFITRGLMTSGKLQKLVERGIVGMTSNPTIFAKAIGDGDEYDDTIKTLLDLDATTIYEKLAIADIQAAADVLLAVYDRTDGEDGYVSLEVSPLLAYDTDTTLSEAKRLFAAVDRPNVMIKIPGTEEGLDAIEEALYAGININITLLFSLENYAKVVERYLRALERRADEGLDIAQIASVASFFLSRIDTVVDNLLESNIRTARMRGSFESTEHTRRMMGQAAIASAKLVYGHFLDVFNGPRWERLVAAGARVQRPLWASTSTKNPAYPDTYYVDALIGPHTVNTLPPATIEAFDDHGTVARTIDQDIDGASKLMRDLAEAGVQMDKVTQQLQSDGVESFANDYRRLLDTVEGKRQVMLTGVMAHQDAAIAGFETTVEDTLACLDREHIPQRIWEKDASVWKEEIARQQAIRDRLGWLDVVNAPDEFYTPLLALRDEVRETGYTHALLLGMGGSSLATEVLRQTFGVLDGFPNLLVLDTTDPQAIRLATEEIDLDRTLFIVSSKSGTTIETISLYKMFYSLVKERRGSAAGDQFCVITDAGSPLEKTARDNGFKYIFLNPADIGGRYSALSYFGLVPAVVMGLDIERLVENARRMATACGPTIPTAKNPAVWLGAAMYALAQRGADKLTLVASPGIDTFGLWVEQLIAESVGKEGRGIVPVANLVPSEARDFDDDRFFVYLRLDGASDELDHQVDLLKHTGQPVVTLTIEDAYALGGEFFRWEFATAVLGYLLQIDPFDQPNVGESKAKTKALLDYLKEHGAARREEPVLDEDGLQFYADPRTVETLRRIGEQRGFHYGDLINLLLAHMAQARSGDYIALMAYLAPTEKHDKLLAAIRNELGHATMRAVTLGYGPRFLHSTGQLHKGGPNTGVFIQITVENNEEIPIPGEPYDFMALKRAQARGDLEALQAKGRRVVRFHLPIGSVSAGLERLLDAIRTAATEQRGW
ncbi:MAG: bifunctional transaldolase/phosoglucose isomerase [Chloroflexi bacterium]|nr:bifunctional transaldolase/phosoglucose isomerase [Chloroflexota bacterium]